MIFFCEEVDGFRYLYKLPSHSEYRQPLNAQNTSFGRCFVVDLFSVTSFISDKDRGAGGGAGTEDSTVEYSGSSAASGAEGEGEVEFAECMLRDVRVN